MADKKDFEFRLKQPTPLSMPAHLPPANSLPLLHEAAHVRMRSSSSSSLRYSFLQNGDVQLLLRLLTREQTQYLKGALVTPKTKAPCGGIALHYAANSGNLEATKLLLSASEIDAKNCSGATPLLLAAKNEHWDICAVLIHVGASLDAADMVSVRKYDAFAKSRFSSSMGTHLEISTTAPNALRWRRIPLPQP